MIIRHCKEVLALCIPKGIPLPPPRQRLAPRSPVGLSSVGKTRLGCSFGEEEEETGCCYLEVCYGKFLYFTVSLFR